MVKRAKRRRANRRCSILAETVPGTAIYHNLVEFKMGLSLYPVFSLHLFLQWDSFKSVDMIHDRRTQYEMHTWRLIVRIVCPYTFINANLPFILSFLKPTSHCRR